MAQESDKLSPMLKQYLDIKQKYSDYILFFRLGDFYEMFFEDAENVSRELELALTSRAGSPMCGVPYHSCEIYIKKLIDKGFKVAICEQLTDPAASKGLVERDVIRLVTAGTVIESSMLSEDSNNYIACICPDEERKSAALVFADISTGEVHVFSKNGKDIEQDIISELSRFSPVEILINQAFLDLFDREKTRDLSQCAYDRGIGHVLLDGCKRNARSINYSNTHAFGSAYRCTGFSSRHCGVE